MSAPRSMRQRLSRPGLTLVELLVVAALLGLLAAMTVGVVGPLATAQRRILAESTMRESLQRARAIAVRRGGCALSLGEALSIRCVRGPSPGRASGPPAPIALPRGWSAMIDPDRTAEIAANRDERSPGSLEFGPDGVTADAEILLIGPRGERVALRVQGLSGAVARLGARP